MNSTLTVRSVLMGWSSRAEIACMVASATAMAIPVGMIVGGVLGWLVAPALIGLAAVWARRRGLAQLRRGEGAESLEPTWEVRVNGVRVGALSDAEYKALWLTVWDEPCLYFGQLFGVVLAFVGFLQKFVRVLAAIAVALFLTAWLSAPQDLASWLLSLGDIHSAKVTPWLVRSSSELRPVMGVLLLLSLGVNSALRPGAVGFRDLFTATMRDRARSLLNVSAKGEISVNRLPKPIDREGAGTTSPT